LHWQCFCKTASGFGQDATRENKTTASEPVHESKTTLAAKPCQLHLVSDWENDDQQPVACVERVNQQTDFDRHGENDDQQPVACVEKVNQQTYFDRHCATFESDAESVKALAASSGWLKGVHSKLVTQPGAIAERMLRAPKEDGTNPPGRTQELLDEQKHSQSKLQQIISLQARACSSLQMPASPVLLLHKQA